MANPIRRCIRGAGYSEKYGSHPGNIPFILLIMAGAIFGLEKSWAAAILSAIYMTLFAGIPWLIGCYARGDEEHSTTHRPQTQQQEMPKKSPTGISVKGLLCICLLLILTYTLAWSGYALNQEFLKDRSSLPEPQTHIQSSTNNLHLVLEKKLHHGGAPAVTRSLRLHVNESKKFRAHLGNIAAQRGWHVHDSQARGVKIAMPAAEIYHLDPMITDPLSWTIQNINNDLPAKGPSDTNLVNVSASTSRPTQAISSTWQAPSSSGPQPWPR